MNDDRGEGHVRTIWAVGYLDCGNTEARDSMGVPEADARGEEDGLLRGELLDDLRDGCFGKVRWWHRVYMRFRCVPNRTGRAGGDRMGTQDETGFLYLPDHSMEYFRGFPGTST